MAAAKPVRHGGGEGPEILLDFKNEGPTHFKRASANDQLIKVRAWCGGKQL